MKLAWILGGLSLLGVACAANTSCPLVSETHPEVTLRADCGLASVTTNCAAKRTLTATSVTFSPTVNETCNVTLVLATGEKVIGSLDFTATPDDCVPWASNWNGRRSTGVFLADGARCTADGGVASDAALGGD